jgi:hypothetical protein
MREDAGRFWDIAQEWDARVMHPVHSNVNIMAFGERSPKRNLLDDPLSSVLRT